MAQVNSDPIDRGNRRYISSIMAAPFLERDHEHDLALRWRDDKDTKALHELISSYARFVVKIASRFRGYGLPLGDLIQEGNIGLMEAAARFDPERNVRFSTYASWWVLASIQEFVLRNASIVRIGTTAAQKRLFFNLRRMRAQMIDNPDGAMSDDDRDRIAEALGVPLAAVERMESHFSRPDQSLNMAIGGDEGGGDEFQDFLLDHEPTPEQNVIESHDGETRAKRIIDALDRLTQRERRIIVSRFMEEETLTLAELGVVFDVSKERIRQIESKALDKLRDVFSDIADDRDLMFA